MDSANEFLKAYVFAINSEFAVEPQDSDNAFLPLDGGILLDHILCVKEQRTLDHGQVFSYNGKRFQITKASYTDYLPPKAKITVMASPYIGIRAAYLHYVFETHPAPTKSPKIDHPKPALIPVDPHLYRSDRPWEPKTGLPWQPGLPTYKESLEIIHEIFTRPYSSSKKKGQYAAC